MANTMIRFRKLKREDVRALGPSKQFDANGRRRCLVPRYLSVIENEGLSSGGSKD